MILSLSGTYFCIFPVLRLIWVLFCFVLFLLRFTNFFIFPNSRYWWNADYYCYCYKLGLGFVEAKNRKLVSKLSRINPKLYHKISLLYVSSRSSDHKLYSRILFVYFYVSVRNSKFVKYTLNTNYFKELARHSTSLKLEWAT